VPDCIGLLDRLALPSQRTQLGSGGCIVGIDAQHLSQAVSGALQVRARFALVQAGQFEPRLLVVWILVQQETQVGSGALDVTCLNVRARSKEQVAIGLSGLWLVVVFLRHLLAPHESF
jgi:hypothetical protein